MQASQDLRNLKTKHTTPQNPRNPKLKIIQIPENPKSQKPKNAQPTKNKAVETKLFPKLGSDVRNVNHSFRGSGGLNANASESSVFPGVRKQHVLEAPCSPSPC